MYSAVRCRAYSGLESSKLEIKIEDRELGDDDDEVLDHHFKVFFAFLVCIFFF